MMTKTEMAAMLTETRERMARLQAQLKAAQGRDAAILRRQISADQKSLNLLRAGMAQ